jgi:hypothetical protein
MYACSHVGFSAAGFSGAQTQRKKPYLRLQGIPCGVAQRGSDRVYVRESSSHGSPVHQFHYKTF